MTASKSALLMILIFGLAGSAIAGDIVGKVLFEGIPPQRAKLKMTADAACLKLHKDPVLSEEVLVNKNGTLKNVLVYVKEGLPARSFQSPADKVVLDQKGCIYTPHVLGIMTGQELEIRNSDPTLHNVHSLSKLNPRFNLGQPKQGMKFTRKFEKPETFKVKCDVHPWMGAWIGVFNHPFFAVTGDDGTYSLKNLPAGEYTIEAWHEKYGTQTMKITVGVADKKTADFKYAAK